MSQSQRAFVEGILNLSLVPVVVRPRARQDRVGADYLLLVLLLVLLLGQGAPGPDSGLRSMIDVLDDEAAARLHAVQPVHCACTCAGQVTL